MNKLFHRIDGKRKEIKWKSMELRDKQHTNQSQHICFILSLRQTPKKV